MNSWSGTKLSKEITVHFYITFGGWYWKNEKYQVRAGR